MATTLMVAVFGGKGQKSSSTPGVVFTKFILCPTSSEKIMLHCTKTHHLHFFFFFIFPCIGCLVKDSILTAAAIFGCLGPLQDLSRHEQLRRKLSPTRKLGICGQDAHKCATGLCCTADKVPVYLPKQPGSHVMLSGCGCF